ncbi:outer membrane beta-barrel protein, partial [Xanthovirga aplysinae]|uniref:outer membrane beta-barrel protein n=1 Tax=Xanthovirga aplysinae TaxID=2529853 RepID=UPI0012BD67E3
FKSQDITTSYRFLTTLRLGAILQINTDQILGLKTGLEYYGKGTRIGTFFSPQVKIRIDYLNVPILAHLSLPIVNGFKMFLEAGYVFSLAFGGQVIEEDYVITRRTDLKIGSSEDSIRRFDFGLNLGGGFEGRNYQVKIGYDLGVANIFNIPDEKARNRVLALSIAYLFNL